MISLGAAFAKHGHVLRQTLASAGVPVPSIYLSCVRLIHVLLNQDDSALRYRLKVMLPQVRDATQYNVLKKSCDILRWYPFEW